MMRAIVRASLHFRIPIGIAAVLLVVGVAQLPQMPVDVLPEFAPPYVEVQTEALGLSTDEVESLMATLLGGGILSIGSLVGFVTVLGIAARNGIIINHYQHLERAEGEAFGPELVLRGARERLSPILMTSLAAGLALLPLVVSGDRPGQEIEHPMAIVILGGLLTSTLLNLLVVPSPYLRFGRARGRAA